MANRNIVWSHVFADELARSGVRHAIIAPGSRSTPLAFAFYEVEDIRAHSLLDERSAAFFALGLARTTQTPVVLLCTSGSAAANFFPAIVEAHETRVPLIVITADRPHELRHSGANQTIDQIKLYGNYALWSVDMPLPEAQAPTLAIRAWRSVANRAVAIASGLRKGVVHLNMPFRKPLEPLPVGDDLTLADDARDLFQRSMGLPHTQIGHGIAALSDVQADMLAAAVDANPLGLIVLGANCPTDIADAVNQLSAQTGYPVLADAASGLRWMSDKFLGGYDSFLSRRPAAWQRPQIVIRFGDVPTSQALNDYLNSPEIKYLIQISESGVWADDSHRLTHLIQVNERFAILQLLKRIHGRQPGTWMSQWAAAEEVVWATLRDAQETPFDGLFVAEAVRLLPDHSTLFVGNSLPVRHLEQFGQPRKAYIHAFASRGASGIDGNISTAFGLGFGRPEHPLCAIVGDVTFYHDMNGLLAARRLNIPITLVVLNNNGGGIFYRLPVAQFDPVFTDLFVTPHHLDFQHSAALYGFDYLRTADLAAFRQAFQDSVSQRKTTLIEVPTDAQADLAARRAYLDKLNVPLLAHDATAHPQS
ncbi:MAG: 2-succinyl-5-enolpyruvyl-6-hydroxy-3-cyclohexene-1-carboxylic-acid synthase [Anaerolineae bacterium]|nr:2-succinyl-5-enolpyruvyl-6-hydroxy-3-cyclohexene-1-carboxylic-acid synthase [Anaerolineae bacterium]MDW8170873.1 2-succinyl-5-enolpyruvyl-6-hydroxy-3-cyclohexene-1-carboxylic-acid synthase [Anaerolineae bacterium]